MFNCNKSQITNYIYFASSRFKNKFINKYTISKNDVTLNILAYNNFCMFFFKSGQIDSCKWTGTTDDTDFPFPYQRNWSPTGHLNKQTAFHLIFCVLVLISFVHGQHNLFMLKGNLNCLYVVLVFFFCNHNPYF